MMSPSQCRAARGLLDWTQLRLSEAARVGIVTVRQFEGSGAQPRPATLDVLQRALEAAGVEFTNGGQPGVRPKGPGRPFDKMERAAIVWQAPVRSHGAQLEVLHTTVNFPTFREAVQHFMTIVPADERKFSKIVTAAGELWLVGDIEQIFDVGGGDFRAIRSAISDEAAIPPIPPDEPYDGSPV
jgi:hypothetical protein